MKHKGDLIRGKIHRTVMRFAHKYNWHYAPPIYPEGDTQLWCQWCGFRETIKRRKGLLEGSIGSKELIDELNKLKEGK